MLKKLTFLIYIVFTLSFLNTYVFANNKNETTKWEEIKRDEKIIFVNALTKKKTYGTKEFPFKTIDEALTHLTSSNKKDPIKAIIYISGSFTSKYSYIVSYPLKIVGMLKNEKKGDSISFEKNTGFVISSSFLEIENCLLSRKELIGEPRAVPLFYSINSHINLKNVNLNVKEGGSVFTLLSSTFLFEKLTCTSTQNNYCNVLEANASNGFITFSNLKCNGRSVIPIDIQNSTITLKDVNTYIDVKYFTVFIRARDSNISINNTLISAKGEGHKKASIIHNKSSHLKLENIKIEGFEKESTLKDDRLDYMK